MHCACGTALVTTAHACLRVCICAARMHAHMLRSVATRGCFHHNEVPLCCCCEGLLTCMPDQEMHGGHACCERMVHLSRKYQAFGTHMLGIFGTGAVVLEENKF